ncbi:type I DNA topoisomerase [Anaerosalibacter massiliensis]|uniref:DNA topoisomerase 1 n=1 Tax=Anaerosalibacter massiliensis TaxID=1347392 RepID=A0A9X2MET9_9FIRM|nr:type I DNA topoisomerase [Anaerosalibacter massiliensis]MCR2042783.1 type I DNA topoisomerase [Anaerosalibacter massiliensis]
MQKNLVIVESPAKAKTIGKFLGKNYKVKASVGHIRDLPKSTLGIDIENDFEPKYITIRGKGPVIKELKSEAKKSDKIYLATDPDREGEAISWHLAHILGLEEEKPVRIEFNEITKDAVSEAIENPRPINRDLVDAQQARRVLDRLVGYKISPLLWRKIRRGLSAGRVQSVAVKLVCDREKEIEDFIPEEYWSIKGIFEKNKRKFEADFYGEMKGNKEIKIDLKSEKDVKKVIKDLDKGKYHVHEVKKGTKRRNPYPPYTTSTLQQDASKRLRFSAKKTMAIAQQLYEGIDIKREGTVGLITYIRTDSTRISQEAMDTASDFIIRNYGKEYSVKRKNIKKKKSSDTQDAHEAIRATSVNRKPEDIKNSLTPDQYKLYKLIWERFIASQMSVAIYETLSIKILSGKYIFRASGSKLKFDGFMKVYSVLGKDNTIGMPTLKKGEEIKLQKLKPNQHFTQPPARYTEASLIKTLEELGIGRPSTYSPTISTILNREYVVIENRSFEPTELGLLVTELLEEYFKNIINEEFTANMEEDLDRVADGKSPWKKVIKDFYSEFHKVLEVAEEEIEKIEIKDEETDVICEKCGRNMVVKYGRYGKFLACPGYPECKNTKPFLEELGVDCPRCGGKIVERRTKKGRRFYGCSNYPKCNFMSWDEPISEKCPKCEDILVKRKNKNSAIIKCMNKSCDYKKVEKNNK